jgi:hypothetical protein
LTSALDGGEWSASKSSQFTPREKAPVPIGEEDGWDPGLVWHYGVEKNFLPLLGIEPRPSSL